jgi:hypothetical protein
VSSLTVYGPPLNTHCTALEGPATVRISTTRTLVARWHRRNRLAVRALEGATHCQNTLHFAPEHLSLQVLGRAGV